MTMLTLLILKAETAILELTQINRRQIKEAEEEMLSEAIIKRLITPGKEIRQIQFKVYRYRELL